MADKMIAWYNHAHCHTGIRFVTPDERHGGADVAILAQRKERCEQARGKFEFQVLPKQNNFPVDLFAKANKFKPSTRIIQWFLSKPHFVNAFGSSASILPRFPTSQSQPVQVTNAL
jgi:hypothetical protein